MKFFIVETESGDQQFFDGFSESLRFAKEQEKRRSNSIEYVGSFNDDGSDLILYRGQTLRWVLRSIDNIPMWIRASCHD